MNDGIMQIFNLREICHYEDGRRLHRPSYSFQNNKHGIHRIMTLHRILDKY